MFFFRTVSLLSALLALVACSQPPLAHQGTLDLSHWDFVAKSEVPLDGQWAVRGSIEAPVEQAWKTLPQAAKSTPESLPSPGNITYRLRLFLPTDRTEWSLILPEFTSASGLWANGLPVISTRTFGTNAEIKVQQVQSRIVDLQTDGPELLLDLEISNLRELSGGTSYSMHFGPREEMQAHWAWSRLKTSFLAGGLLVLGLLNLFGYSLRGRSMGTVWYSILAFLISLRTLFTNSAPGLDLLPDSPLQLVIALKYLTAMGGLVAFGRYLKASFPVRWHSIGLTIFEFYTLLVAILCFVLPVKAFTEVFELYYVVPMILTMFLCLATVASATMRRVEGARHLLPAVILLLLSALNDTLASQRELPWGPILPDCLLLFMVYGYWLESVRTSLTYRLSLDQAQKLSQLDTMKDDFLARVTHELRTPLHGILGILAAFQGGDFGTVTPRQAFHQKLLESSSRRLLRMVNSIIDFSNLRGGTQVGELQLIVLQPFIELLVVPFRAHLKPGVDLINSISPYLPLAWGDPGKVAQVVQNLLANALEHTWSGTIAVEAEVADHKLTVSVRDTGSGIDEEALKHIFSPFQQSQNAENRTKNGLGLGLAVSSRLMEQMGESLKIESEIGRGTRVLLTLPLATQAQRLTREAGESFHSGSDPDYVGPLAANERSLAPPERQPELSPSHHATILVVDDEAVNLMLLERFVAKMNYQVLAASSGIQALEILKSTKVDLMILDIMMPGMSGYEVTRVVRQTHPLAELPILLLTAKNNLEDQLRGLEMGANDFITKPFERADLQSRLDFHLLLRNKSG